MTGVACHDRCLRYSGHSIVGRGLPERYTVLARRQFICYAAAVRSTCRVPARLVAATLLRYGWTCLFTSHDASSRHTAVACCSFARALLTTCHNNAI